MNKSNTKVLNKIFDVDWYSAKTRVQFHSIQEALEHYRGVNAKDRCSCSPYLDESYYNVLYPDVPAAAFTALDHYITHGDKEGRNPHPLINTLFYKNKYNTTEIVLIDFLERGDTSSHSTSQVFMSEWYSRQYGVSTTPLLHYILNGFDPKFTPNPAFEPLFVKKTIGVPDDKNIYAAYSIGPGRKNQSFNEIFDHAHYRDTYSALEAVTHGHYENLFEEFVDSPIKADPNPIFSRSYYRGLYQISDTTVNEFADFLSIENQYRDPHPFFSTKYYYNQRPDVWNAHQNALKHFYLAGFAENTDPHPLFCCNEYYDVNQDVKSSGMNPLIHYLRHGKYEKRRLRKIEQVVSNARRLKNYVPYSRNFKTNSESVGKKLKSIGVFIHIYYPELCQEILMHTNNIPIGSTIYISTNSSEKAYKINQMFYSNSKHKHIVKVVENRGRDIAPMLIGFREELASVDIALHLHTKKSKHYENGFDEWRKYLLGQNCGSIDRVESIISAFDDPNVGAIAPLDFPAIEKVINWGGNIKQINKLIGLMSNNEFAITELNKLELPSGSMFWFRPSALRPLLELNLPLDIFDPEEGQVDGTLAHALERAFFYIVELAGYKWLRFKATSDLTNNLNFLHGTLLPIHSGTRPAVITNPEMRYFTAYPSEVERPRLNLLIPTAERALGYAGISEALRLFEGFCDKLSDIADIRVINTDMPFSDNISIPPGASLSEMEEDTEHVPYAFVDGTTRAHQLLSLRKKDIFVATAWWTAIQAKSLVEQRNKLFSSKSKTFVYLIQDFECGFYPWSSRYAFAESTYHQLGDIIPIFNTGILSKFFLDNGYTHDGIIYDPPINEKIAQYIDCHAQREKIVLIYMRRAALRNCLEFADGVIYEAIKQDRVFWQDWKFIAIGEEFDPRTCTRSGVIEGGQRLSLDAYGKLISKSLIGLSFMVSPHPSYPPLEMAAAGMRVITNNFRNKDLSHLHENIESFDIFDERQVATRLRNCANSAIEDSNNTRHQRKARCNWFFEGKTNMNEVFSLVSQRIRDMLSTL